MLNLKIRKIPEAGRDPEKLAKSGRSGNSGSIQPYENKKLLAFSGNTVN
jgi:hypothetical protein